MTQNQEIKKIPLEVGKTQIGSMMGKFKGEVYNFQIFYGNYILPSPHGKFIHYNQNLYKQKLFQFLDSKEGQIYIRPTEEEIEEATQIVISKESQLISKQEETSEIVQPEPELNKEVEQEPILDPVDELELINLQKRVKVMLAIVIIQFISIAALVALRVIKL